MSLRLIIIMLSLVLILGCSKKQSTEPNPESSLIGNYTSLYFNTSGPADELIDVQSAGGSVQFMFDGNFKYSAVFKYPKDMWQGYSGDTVNYSGTYTISNDTIYLNQFCPGVYSVKWDRVNNSLKSVNLPRADSFILIKAH